jgi:hypothetical protein
MAEENKAVEDLNVNKDKSLDENSLTIENEDKDESLSQDVADDYKEIIELKEEFVKSKKKSTLSKILIGLIVFLILLLALGITLYFLGFFTPKEEPIQVTIQDNAPIEVKEETYKFDIKDINSKKLNEQLSYLTNKNINQDKTEELEKIENEKRIIEEQKRREEEAYKIQEEALLKEKAAIEEKKIELENEKAQLEAMKQEALRLKEELEANKTKLEVVEPINNEVVVQKQETMQEPVSAKNDTNNSFLKLINVAKIKGSLYKKYLDKITAINSSAILCRDDKNRIEIYFGPFNNDEKRAELLDKLLDKGFDEAFELELTQEEFDKRCNY